MGANPVSEEVSQPAQSPEPAPGELASELKAYAAAARARATRPTYRLTRQIYLRGLGLIYLIAFLSLWVQIDGLIGSDGVLPVRDFLDAVRRFDPNHPYTHFPTLLWLGP